MQKNTRTALTIGAVVVGVLGLGYLFAPKTAKAATKPPSSSPPASTCVEPADVAIVAAIYPPDGSAPQNFPIAKVKASDASTAVQANYDALKVQGFPAFAIYAFSPDGTETLVSYEGMAPTAGAALTANNVVEHPADNVTYPAVVDKYAKRCA